MEPFKEMDRIVDVEMIEGLRRAAARTRTRRSLTQFDRLATAYLLIILALGLGAIWYAAG